MGSSGSVFTLVVSESLNSCRFFAGPTILLSYDTGSGVGCPWIYFCCCGSLVIEGLERSLYSPWLVGFEHVNGRFCAPAFVDLFGVRYG